ADQEPPPPPLVDESTKAGVAIEPRLEQRRRDAVGNPETEDQPLAQTLSLREVLERRDGKVAPGERLAVARRRLHVRVAHPADESTGAGPGGEILGRVPVNLIVARAKAAPRVVGDLVVLEAARRGGASEAPVLIDLCVLRRQPLDAGRAPEAAGVQGEAIGGEVVGLPVEHRLDGTSPAVEVEAGQAVHEVDAQVVAAGLPRRLERRAGAARVVEPTEPRRDRIVERLGAEAPPAAAGGGVARGRSS